MDTHTQARLQRLLSQREIIDKEWLETIPIEECGEPLVNLADFVPGMVVSMSPTRLAFAGTAILRAREHVAQMLRQVAVAIAPEFHLIVFDAYRPIAYQRHLYEEVCADIRRRIPGASEEQLRALTFQVVFPPDEDPGHPPPHATGGAVDLTLAREDGIALDMGSRYDVYDDSEENERHMTNSSAIMADQRHNRFRLLEAMAVAGFCNFPGEWWHYMFGDQEYAAYEGLLRACYGRADLLEVGSLR